MSWRSKLFSIFLLFLVLAMKCTVGVAQGKGRASLSGLVLDDSTKAPIVNANVFLANTMIGTSSDSSGHFELKNLAPGFYELVGSCVGYSFSAKKIQIVAGVDQQIDLHLVPKDLNLGVVEVTAKQPEEWKENLKVFEKLLFGSTPEASECRIVNPEVLDFSAEGLGRFRARTDRDITIENMATGFRLHMNLGAFSFDGRWLSSEYKIRYEEIQPLEPEMRSKWQSRRDDVYSSSLHHFLAALVDGELADDGFAMYNTESMARIIGDAPLYELKRRDILKESAPNEWTLSFRKFLVVTYDRRQVDLAPNQQYPEPGRSRDRTFGSPLRSKATRPQLSILTLTKSSISVDSRGQILDQLSLRVSGDWAKEGLARQLPIEFQPLRKK